MESLKGNDEKMTQQPNYNLIPERIMKSLKDYVNEGTPVGDFLFSVLSNDLFRSIGKADSQMLPLLPLLVSYIFWEVPHSCHGSPERIKEWIQIHENKGIVISKAEDLNEESCFKY